MCERRRGRQGKVKLQHVQKEHKYGELTHSNIAPRVTRVAPKVVEVYGLVGSGYEHLSVCVCMCVCMGSGC